jgi:hypothetical protein
LHHTQEKVLAKILSGIILAASKSTVFLKGKGADVLYFSTNIELFFKSATDCTYFFEIFSTLALNIPKTIVCYRIKKLPFMTLPGN